MEDFKKVLENINVTEKNLKLNSNKVSAGDVFVAIKGANLDGHDYISEAVSRGAAYIICQDKKFFPENSFGKSTIIYVEDTKQALSIILDKIFGVIPEDFKVFGVTGTNGKTTTVYLIEKILEENGIKTGFISTVQTKISKDLYISSELTTPGILDIRKFIRDMILKGCKAAVIEISSHALSQRRICGLSFDSAVFTNLSPEHLDYHLNMNQYFNDKVKIFDYLKKDGVGIINFDDKIINNGVKSLNKKKIVSFGFSKEATLSAGNIRTTSEGTVFNLNCKDKFEIKNITSSMFGDHNIYNILAAIGALLNQDLTEVGIREAIRQFIPPSGRMEQIPIEAPFKVFVDYAHTPEALEKVLSSVKKIFSEKLICVFGCGGNRDKKKRPLMGEIASRIADRVIITSDNPRMESPIEIIKQIESGVIEEKSYLVCEDRASAIKIALEEASNGGVVVIAGKGHENYQIVGERKLEFDDKKAVYLACKDLGYIR